MALNIELGAACSLPGGKAWLESKYPCGSSASRFVQFDWYDCKKNHRASVPLWN
jgi:hypothetical protein